jgi:uncharacterized protein DUF2278
MPLPRYGVAIGKFVRFTRDPQHDFGSWYHGHVSIDAAGTPWESALDVDAPVAVGIAYRIVTGLDRSDLGPVGSQPAGWTALAHDSASGALDYLRSPVLQNGILPRALRRALPKPRAPKGWVPPPADIGLPGGTDPSGFEPAPFQPDAVDAALRALVGLRTPFERFLKLKPHSFPWIDSDGDNALDALEPHLQAAARVYLFGDRYKTGNGVHDIHMNQGDPLGTQWYPTNGTWQDGAVVCEAADGRVVIWQTRFKTQSLHTDDGGHPI